MDTSDMNMNMSVMDIDVTSGNLTFDVYPEQRLIKALSIDSRMLIKAPNTAVQLLIRDNFFFSKYEIDF